VVFAAYTGVRVAELQGLQVGDVTLSSLPATVGSVRIRRTKKKTRAVSEAEGDQVDTPLQWTEGTPKSDASTLRVRTRYELRSAWSVRCGSIHSCV
jgi:integrase